MCKLSLEQLCDQCGKCLKTESLLGEHLMENHEDENIPTTSKCKSCDYESDDEDEMNRHVNVKHKLCCDLCNLDFESDRKLKNHTCKILVSNPSCGDSYTKNWILSHGCTRVFSHSLKREIVFLHSQQCVDGVKSCPDILSDYDIEMVNYDGEIWHDCVDKFISEGKIDWEDLRANFGINIK